MMIRTEVYLSEILDKPVVDHGEERMGKVVDVAVHLQEAFPRAVGLLVRLESKGRDSLILLSEVDRIGKRDVLLKRLRKQIPLTGVRADEILLRRSILDKQIVDLNGARVVRVNDLKLAMVGNDVRLIGAEVGLMGIVRRLGWDRWFERLNRWARLRIPETLIAWNYLEFLSSDLAAVKLTVPHRRISDLHPADIASILSQASSIHRSAIFAALSTEAAAESLHELTPIVQAYLIGSIDVKKAVNILEKMPPDETADLLADLSDEKREEFLRLLRPRRAEKIRALMTHPDETAGGLMTTEFMTIQASWTAEQTITHLRANAPDAETIYYLYVIDEQEKLSGVLSLRRLIVSPPQTVVSQLMMREVRTVIPDMAPRQVADVISKYNLLAVPVVGESGKILGIVTVDDVMDYIRPALERRKRHMLG